MKIEHDKKIALEYGAKSAEELSMEIPYTASTIRQTAYKLKKAGVKINTRDRRDEFAKALQELL